MPTPTGIIRFSDVTNEFGTPAGNNLGAFRVSRSVGTLLNLPLDVDVPQSGTISLGNLRNKRLNVVIDYTGLPDNFTRANNNYNPLNARSNYDANSGVVVIGEFKTRPLSPQNIRLIINTNTRIGSSPGNILNVALRTGNWRNSANNALTTVIMELGSSSKIYGSGGNGGNGGAAPIIGDGFDENGEYFFYIIQEEIFPGNGGDGTSAIGIDYPTIVNNQGRIQCGGGGGGGGAFREYTVNSGKKNFVASHSTGGGGGSGAGLSFGAGGTAETGAYGYGTNGSGGGSGNHESAGAGGAGGLEAGSGGVGGEYGNGGSGGGTENQVGASGGNAGFAFVISGSGSISGGGGFIAGGGVSGNPT